MLFDSKTNRIPEKKMSEWKEFERVDRDQRPGRHRRDVKRS